MPFILVSTKVNLGQGPSVVGDELSDERLMKYLEAELIREKCSQSAEWLTKLSPRIVLNKLEAKGYSVISCTGVGQT